MSITIYRKAQRLAIKDRKASGGGTLAVLDENKLEISYRESAGIIDIPMDLIAGTLTESRALSFSPHFSL